MQEQWKIIDEYPLYEVSSCGRVRRGSRTLKPHILKNGYASVVLRREGRPRRFLLHRLVAIAFIEPQPAGCQVAHGDGVRLNNVADNLSWKTPAENGADKVRHGTSASREKHGRAVLTANDVAKIRAMNSEKRTKARNWGRVTIARELGLPLSAVSNVLAGRTWVEVAK